MIVYTLACLFKDKRGDYRMFIQSFLAVSPRHDPGMGASGAKSEDSAFLKRRLKRSCYIAPNKHETIGLYLAFILGCQSYMPAPCAALHCLQTLKFGF
jgi:hypothetical protein